MSVFLSGAVQHKILLDSLLTFYFDAFHFSSVTTNCDLKLILHLPGRHAKRKFTPCVGLKPLRLILL